MGLTEVGWYLSLILKSVVGVGRFDSFVMEFHHVVTLALVIWSYATGFTRVGAFTAVYFVSRIVLLPAVVIRSTLLDLPGAVTPEEWSGAVVYTWYTTNALLLALWALNVWWLGPIVRVIARSAARKEVK